MGFDGEEHGVVEGCEVAFEVGNQLDDASYSGLPQTENISVFQNFEGPNLDTLVVEGPCSLAACLRKPLLGLFDQDSDALRIPHSVVVEGRIRKEAY